MLVKYLGTTIEASANVLERNILTLKKVLAGSKNHKPAWNNVHWQTIFVVKKVLIFRTAVEKQGLDCQI